MKVLKSVQFENEDIEVISKALQIIVCISRDLDEDEDVVLYKMLGDYNFGKFAPKDNIVHFVGSRL